MTKSCKWNVQMFQKKKKGVAKIAKKVAKGVSEREKQKQDSGKKGFIFSTHVCRYKKALFSVAIPFFRPPARVAPLSLVLFPHDLISLSLWPYIPFLTSLYLCSYDLMSPSLRRFVLKNLAKCILDACSKTPRGFFIYDLYPYAVVDFCLLFRHLSHQCYMCHLCHLFFYAICPYIPSLPSVRTVPFVPLKPVMLYSAIRAICAN